MLGDRDDLVGGLGLFDEAGKSVLRSLSGRVFMTDGLACLLA